MPRRLAAKLILSFTAIVFVVEGSFALINVRSQEKQLLSSMILGADQLSRSIVSATWHAMLADRRDAAYEVMQTIAHKQGIDRIRIFNKEGKVTFTTAAGGELQVDKRGEACFLCHAEAQPLVRVDVPSRARIFRGADGQRRLAMVTPIYNEPACSDASCHAHPAGRNVLGVLDVSLGLAPVDAELRGIRARMLLVVGVEIAIIGAFIVVFTRRWVGRPIASLIEATGAVSKMELDQPVRVDTTGELADLAASFDAMRRRLQVAVADLNQLTQSLEDKVEERTRQLQDAQQRLVQADRLASLGQLAASVAHEINNPVAGVLNLALLMQRILRDEGIPAERLPEFRRYLALVAAETERVGRIVGDLLAFSRRSRPQAGPADLNAIVTTTLAIAAHRLELAEVEPIVSLEQELPLVRGDGAQIQQVVLNLVINAAEAMAEGGRLSVATRRGAGSDRVELEVSDTGSGIPPEHLAHIFDPFFTTKEAGQGVGLGLAVAYGIVQAHGGDIAVTSRPGQGSTFRVTLPAEATGAPRDEEGGEHG